MPFVAQLVTTDLQAARLSGTNTITHPEDLALYFPSSLTREQLTQCVPGLANIEERLRTAQLEESLHLLRTQLIVRARLMDYKRRHVRHQVQNTRARRQLDVNDEKVKTLEEKYRAARAARLKLTGPGAWEQTWRELNHDDVRTMLPDDDPINARHLDGDGRAVLSEGRRTTSWIWMSVAQLNAGRTAPTRLGSEPDGEHTHIEEDENIQAFMQEGVYFVCTR